MNNSASQIATQIQKRLSRNDVKGVISGEGYKEVRPHFVSKPDIT